MLFFSGKKNAIKLIGQTFSRKLLGLIVHGSDNVSSIECVSLQPVDFGRPRISVAVIFSSYTF